MDWLDCNKFGFVIYHITRALLHKTVKETFKPVHIQISQSCWILWLTTFPWRRWSEKHLPGINEDCTCDLNFFKGSISTSVDMATKTLSKSSEHKLWFCSKANIPRLRKIVCCSKLPFVTVQLVQKLPVCLHLISPVKNWYNAHAPD